MFDYLNEFLFFTGKSKNKTSYKTALRLSKMGQSYIFNKLCQDWINVFSWNDTNKDSTLDTTLIEKTILFDGVCAFSKLDNMMLNFRANSLNNLSFYGLPNSCNLLDYSGKNYGIKPVILDTDLNTIGECVLVFDNSMRTRPIDTIIFYTEKLTQINTQINAALKNVLGTSVVFAHKDQIQEMTKLFERANNGLPITIAYSENKEYEEVKQPMMLSGKSAHEVLQTLLNVYDKIYADFLLDIGVRANNETDRSSGITPLEITEHRSNTDIKLNNRLKQRKKAVSQLAKLGYDTLSVDLSNFDSPVDDYLDNGDQQNRLIQEEN